MSSQVEISGYDPQWAEEYMQEQRKIVEALKDVCVGIEHIGSTSVPNLGAKPIIDIMVGVEELASLQSEHRERLQGFQYEYVYKPDFPERAFFRRGEWGAGTHHLHIYKYKGEHWENHLLFRDYLKAHPDSLRAYDTLKKIWRTNSNMTVQRIPKPKDHSFGRWLSERSLKDIGRDR